MGSASETPLPDSNPASRPVSALRQFILKIASRCDLACDYCYVYRMADSSWSSQPRTMSPRILHRTAQRIGEHAGAHGLDAVSVVFHGGEPLLAGEAYIAQAARALRASLPDTVALDLRVQTHAGLLDERLLTVLAEHGIAVGISLDGAREHHDRHRLRVDGTGSYDRTAAGLRLLTEGDYRHLFSGLLCVVDLANDPVEVYEALLAFAPPAVDFLLPHGNWSNPPPGRAPSPDAPYGAWLVAAFDRWYSAPRQETAVRLFQEVIHLHLGGQSVSEQVGLSPVAFVVVDTDGALQQVDTLKSVRPGGPATGMHVDTHTMDDVLAHPDIQARQLGLAGLCGTCRDCRVVRVCGGGAYVHRYHPDNGFANPSVYCLDLQHLITHVMARVDADLGRRP
ncbi:FxsB family cyclophane-forming radical SAM/SPASM peptide maturase [Dactylosporangium sp. NPDC049525]|uniref:FxsB family cyclophane-forming radical SAM/SPASM peptide maturase n=1 Tax=Dactylosporangium sp. NPDC049525 TaxID=3154730 RepID=UPI0034256E2C